MKYYSIDEVANMDKDLNYLAFYEVTKGMYHVIESGEKYTELQKKVAKKFNEFKKMIQCGECSLEFITQQVLKKNGPFSRPKETEPTSPEAFKEAEEWEIHEEDVKKKPVKSAFDSFLDGLYNIGSEKTFMSKDMSVAPMSALDNNIMDNLNKMDKLVDSLGADKIDKKKKPRKKKSKDKDDIKDEKI